MLGIAPFDPDVLQALQDCLAAIYGAVLDPSQWQAAMSVLAPFLMADSVHLLHLDRTRRDAEGACSWFLGASQFRDLKTWPAYATFSEHLLRCPPLQLISVDSLVGSPQEKQSKPVVEGNSVPAGCGSMAGMHFPITDDWFAVLYLYRGSRGGVSRPEQGARLELLAPHIQQALRLSKRLQRLETRLAVRALVLDRCRIAAVICDGTGEVIEINERADRLLMDHAGVLCVRGSRIEATNARSDRVLQQWIRNPQGLEAQSASPVMCLASSRAGSGLECTVLRYTPDRRPPFPRRDLRLLLLRQYGETMEIDPRSLKAHLGLTTSQADVLARLAMGATLAEIAVTRGNTLETIRSYVKALNRKLDCHNQAQLVAKALTTFVLIA